MSQKYIIIWYIAILFTYALLIFINVKARANIKTLLDCSYGTF